MSKQSRSELTRFEPGQDWGLDPAAFVGLRQTYVIQPNGSGQLQTTISETIKAGGSDDLFHFAELPTRRADPTNFDPESIYLLAWQSSSVAATVTAISDGEVVGSSTVLVGNDPMQVKIDWDVIDQVVVSYTGTPGFPVTDNLLFL
jgi:hypothetical protein